MEKQNPHQPNMGGGKIVLRKTLQKQGEIQQRACHPHGGYESANSPDSRTRSADVTVVSNASSKPPTNITTNQMPPSDQQTMIEYTNSLESELDNAKEHVASMATTKRNTPPTPGRKKNVGAAEQVYGNDEQLKNKDILGEETTQQPTHGEGK